MINNQVESGVGMPATYTPIRYPGGKTKLYPEVRSILSANNMLGGTYAEAFAGGAGIACKLLLKGEVSRIVINDLDRAVFCMWDMIVHHPRELCDFIGNVELSVDEWKRQREIFRNQAEASDADLGCAAFFLNRTNRSGILNGGVIGGLNQAGPYKIDARFNREGLKRKVENLARMDDRIDIHNLDAEDFISSVLQTENTFAYFDPPYVKKGPGLYENSFDEAKHKSLARSIGSCGCAWMITYDDDELVNGIYCEYDSLSIDITYSAYSQSRGSEILILKPGLNNPLLAA